MVTSSIKGTTPPAKPSDRDKTVRPGGYQYVARGIYIDRLKSAHKATIINKINSGDDTWKAITPFYDVNLTLLGNWSTTDPAIADVTQEDIQSILDPANNYYGTYSRGRLEALDDGVVDLKVMAYAGNAGIIGGDAISVATQTELKQDDGIEITVDSKTSSEKFFAIVGNVSCLITRAGVTDSCETNNNRKDTYVDLTALRIIEYPSQFTCETTVPKGKATPFYSCQNVSTNWSGFIQFSMSVPGGTAVVTVQYPNSTTNNLGILNLPLGISSTSTNEYNIIVNVYK